MPKKSERSEVEHLRGLVRKLKSENRNLKKSLARSNKNVRISTQLLDNSVFDLEEDTQENSVYKEDGRITCKHCKALYTPKPLGKRILHCCETCGKKWSTKI